MGVKGLWPLLEPVGRRVNIEALTNKRLAVDASIWVHQFIKTMRAADGEVLRNAHLLGFFRRICKLLFNHIKPVFVFDGATPALKRNTTIARRRQREKQSVKLRKAAEKLLMAQLKKRALDTMQAEQALQTAKSPPKKRLKTQPQEAAPEAAAAPVDLTADAPDTEGGDRQQAVDIEGGSSDDNVEWAGEDDELEEEGDEMDAATRHMYESIAASDRGGPVNPTLREEMFGIGRGRGTRARKVRRAHMPTSNRPPPQPQSQSMPMSSSAGRSAPAPHAGPSNAPASPGNAEENGDGEEEEEDEDDEGELVLEAAELGNLDPAMLSHLPQSVQLDLMAKLRDQKTYMNREGFQRRQAQPQNFSQFQMEEYLKASAFRKQMAGLQDEMNAAVTGEGSSSKRIAGEVDREYILQKDAPLPGEAKEKSESGRFGRFGSGHSSGGLGKPPLAPSLGGRKMTPTKSGSGVLPSTRQSVESVLDAPSSSGGLQISLDLEDLDMEAGSGGEDEWEDVETAPSTSTSRPRQGDAPSGEVDLDLTKKPSDWRERMKQRQKFWSHSNGFRMGRKLGDWGKDGGRKSGSQPEAGEEAPMSLEDAEVQKAIALSLRDAERGGSNARAGGEEDAGADQAGPSQLGAGGGAGPSRPPAAARGDNEEEQELQKALDLSLHDFGGYGKEVSKHRSQSKASRPHPAHQPPDPSAVDRQAGSSREPVDLAGNDDEWEDAAAPPAPPPPAPKPAVASSGKASGAGAADDWEDVVVVRDSGPPGPSPAALKTPPPVDGKAEANPLPDVRLQAAEAAVVSGGEPAKPDPSPLPGHSQGASGARTPPKPVVVPEEHIRSPFQSPVVQSEAAGKGVAVKGGGKEAGGEPAERKEPPSAAKRRLVLPPAPGSRKKAPTRKQAPAPAKQQEPGEADEKLPAPEPPLSRSQPSGAQLRDGGGVSVTAAPSESPEVERDDIKLSPAAEGQSGPSEPRSVPAKASPAEPAVAMPEASPPQPEVLDKGGGGSPPCMAGGGSGAWDGGTQVVLAGAVAPNPGGGGGGLVPVADSTITSPDAEARWGGGHGSRAGTRQGGLTPIADSSVLHSSQGGASSGGMSLDPGPLDEDAWVPDDGDEPGLGLRDSDRLSSEGLRLNPLPEHLARQIEAHAGGAGDLQSVPSELARQIEAHNKETKRLQKEHRKQAGISDTPTGAMYGECQELLQMFGLPYIIAPMEAEAQCAWLDQHNLVDGVVTDDNDVFLFGGQHIYRHIFSEKQYVEEYRSSDFPSELGLDRQKLIYLALLLGSDYTEGIPGVGIVNAVEIVNAFEGKEGLKAFKEWVMTPDKDVLAEAQRVGGKGRKGKGPASQAEGEDGASEGDEVLRKFKYAHRGARKNWDLPNDFPNWRVVDAYTQAKVDGSKEAITFARPDLEHLRNFCTEKFGWAANKTDELIIPVLKAYDEKQTQSTMDGFLNFSQRFAKIKSKRLQKAVAAIRGSRNQEIDLVEGEEGSPPKKRGRKRKAAAPAEAEAEAGVFGEDDFQLSQEEVAMLDALSSPEAAKSGPAKRGRGRGRGRTARGRGRGRKAAGDGGPTTAAGKKSRGSGKPPTGRGRQAKKKASPEPEASSSESDDQEEANVGGTSAPSEITLRPRQKTNSLGERGGDHNATASEEESEWEAV